MKQPEATTMEGAAGKAKLRWSLILACLLVGGIVWFTSVVKRTPDLSGHIDLSDLDTGAPLRTDFYQYANGGWLRRHPVPDDQLYVTRFATSQPSLVKLLQGLAAGSHPEGSDQRILADFYLSGMDTEAIETAGIEPLREELARIDSISTLADLNDQVARLHLSGIRPYFRIGSTHDPGKSGQIAEAHQPDLGLPDPSAYTRPDVDAVNLREAYQGHIERMFLLLGDSSAKAKAMARAVVELEARLAKASKTAAQLRDPHQTYNLQDLASLVSLTPHWDWEQYLKSLGVKASRLNLTSVEYFRALDREWAQENTALEVHKAYLRWVLLRQMAEYLSTPWLSEQARFSSQVLGGARNLPPREQQVTRVTNHKLDMALGRVYVERYFSTQSKAKAEGIVAGVKQALVNEIESASDWSPEQRQRALSKLQSLRLQIGFPDRWRDYSGLKIKRRGYAANVLAINGFLVRRELDKIGRPPNPEDWPLAPQTSNAYLSASDNSLTIPAGLLRPPFFSEQFDDALNFGGLGTIAGHELVHAFDDVGNQFDAQGRLLPASDAGKAAPIGGQNHAALLMSQDGQTVDQALVRGECLADAVGLRIAYQAFVKATEGKPETELDGFTPQQRFFLSYAQIWATNMRPDYEKAQARSNPHPHPRYRVNGTVSGMAEFQRAFAVGRPEVSP